jgi:hypothetical protein
VSDAVLSYSPPRSLTPFYLANKLTNLVIGPLGSMKTTAGIMKIIYEAKQIAPCRDGIRRSRAAWVRNTREMLRDSSIPDFLKWYPDGVAGTYHKTEGRFVLRADDVECEVLFRGLDESNDVRRLLSLQLTFGIMDEFREINPSVYEALVGRVGRYPDKTLNGVGARTAPSLGHPGGLPLKKVWGMSNPPDAGSFWEKVLTNPPANMHVSFQPSGASPEADWLQWLDEGYYTDLMELHKGDQDWIDVNVHARFGASLAGKPVFRAFDMAQHVAKETTTPIPSAGLIIGVDAGLTPAAVLAQVDYTGRLVVHDVLTSEGMGALRFVREKLKPLLANKYRGFRALVVIDPAAFQRVQTDERCVADVFKTEGFTVKPARTNTITARISAVDQYLTRLVQGKPALLISPVGCEVLVRGLRSDYRYRMNTKGELDDKPEKSHPVSDVVDALQYVCLHADDGLAFGAARTTRREQRSVPYTYC